MKSPFSFFPLASSCFVKKQSTSWLITLTPYHEFSIKADVQLGKKKRKKKKNEVRFTAYVINGKLYIVLERKKINCWLGKLKCSSAHWSHLSPTTLSLQWHRPWSSQSRLTDPRGLHSQCWGIGWSRSVKEIVSWVINNNSYLFFIDEILKSIAIVKLNHIWLLKSEI